jgi:hypothetical protein
MNGKYRRSKVLAVLAKGKEVFIESRSFLLLSYWNNFNIVCLVPTFEAIIPIFGIDNR